jgi:hypothetical protein
LLPGPLKFARADLPAHFPSIDQNRDCADGEAAGELPCSTSIF